MVLQLQRPVPSADALSDVEVVDRVLAGETALYEILMRRYNQRLYRIARSVLRDPAEAEDVMQDAYVRAFENLAQFEGAARFSTWLTRIALHEALARRRKRNRLVGLPDPDEGAGPGADAGGSPWMRQRGELPARHDDPERGAFAAELRAALEAALDALPESLRLAFLTRHVEGMSTAEAAACLGVSESALKVRVHRARERLRDDLERRMGEAVRGIYEFGAERCDRVVARVLERVGAEGGSLVPPAGEERP